MRAIAIASLVGLSSVSTSFAAPTAPDGWTVSNGIGHTVYRPNRPDVELRLFAPTSTQTPMMQWFASRRNVPPKTVSAPAYEAAQDMNGLTVAVGTAMRGRAAVVVVALACPRRDGGLVYAELIAPQDMTVLKDVMRGAATTVAADCQLASFAPAAATPSRTTTSRTATTTSTTSAPRRNAPADAPYAYRTTDPSRALGSTKIAALLHTSRAELAHLYSTVYLLLPDGTARNGLPPVPPDEFDVAAEKQGDPKVWGQWKREGNKYVVKFAADKTFFAPPDQGVWTRGKAGEQLTGDYEWNDAEIGPYGYSAHRSIRFEGNRFSQSGSGGSAIVVPGGVSVGTSYDDNGVSTTVTGAHVGGGSTRASTSAGADRRGTYRIDGLVLELHYDNGVVNRHFFTIQPDRTWITFSGQNYYKLKK